MPKTHSERIGKLEVYHAQIAADLKTIKEDLAKLNGSVAENTKFRVQQKTVYAVLGFAWASLLIPIAAIAIATLR